MLERQDNTAGTNAAQPAPLISGPVALAELNRQRADVQGQLDDCQRQVLLLQGALQAYDHAIAGTKAAIHAVLQTAGDGDGTEIDPPAGGRHPSPGSTGQ